jgi:hypothetical protein
MGLPGQKLFAIPSKLEAVKTVVCMNIFGIVRAG